MEKKTRRKSDFLSGFSLTKNIDKYGIINLIIWVSIPVILAIIIVSMQNRTTSTSSSSSESSSYTTNDKNFSNKYGTATTKCSHSSCDKYIAPTGDTNCCITHSNKCGNCGKYIDEDALYCMDCIESTLKNKRK